MCSGGRSRPLAGWKPAPRRKHRGRFARSIAHLILRPPVPLSVTMCRRGISDTRAILAVPFLISLLLTAGCHERLPTAASEPRLFQLETLISARQSGITTPRREVITNAGRWSAFLSETDLAGQSEPTVDFSREMVIVAALGTQADSCKTVAISSVTGGETRGIIHVNEQRLP